MQLLKFVHNCDISAVLIYDFIYRKSSIKPPPPFPPGGAYTKSHILDEMHNNFPIFTITLITKTEQEIGFVSPFCKCNVIYTQRGKGLLEWRRGLNRAFTVCILSIQELLAKFHHVSKPLLEKENVHCIEQIAS